MCSSDLETANFAGKSDDQRSSITCAVCHDPHGSVANNLLAQNEPFLCLQCHEGHFHMLRKGFDPESGAFNDGDKAAALAQIETDTGSTTFTSKTAAQAAVDNLSEAQTDGVRFFYNESNPGEWDVSARASNADSTTAANPHGTEGFQMSFGTKCTTCHQVVHGSDYPSQPLNGGGLTR